MLRDLEIQMLYDLEILSLTLITRLTDLVRVRAISYYVTLRLNVI